MKTDYWVAYNGYFATGEGSTSWIAIANTAEEAERLFNEHVPDPFRKETVVSRSDRLDPDVKKLIPKRIREFMASRTAHMRFFQSFHYNFS